MLALTIPFVCAANTSYALEERTVYSPTGESVFQIRFFDVGDGAFMEDEPDPMESTWNLNSLQKEKIISAVSYWAELIKPDPELLPAVINVGTFDDVNAAGNSNPVFGKEGFFSITQIQAALLGVRPDARTFGSHAQFVMGKMNFDSIPYIPSQLLRPDGEADLVGTAFHELAHGLGVGTSITDKSGPDTPHFESFLGSLDQGLRDDNGNPSRPGQSILCSLCNNPYDPGAFDVRKDQAYFFGKNVSQVLGNAMPGIPVKMLYYPISGEAVLDDNYMSHFELKNSMMSHQSYQNYSVFMEAELAALQDFGYDIDRRNFFGYSIYGNDRYLVNQNGYFKRNPEGTAYLPGQYNTATMGLGLHVYGHRNTILQQADLLAQGAGAAGIRVDGQANQITILPGTRVHANGLNGRGIMFTYGKDHDLILRGDVQALGDLGIGASFDFGNNAMGNDEEYRGSYILNSGGNALPLLDELNGALVNSFDLTGHLAGKEQAIYISRNALVNNINVMQGAHIQGNIRSDYAQVDANGNPRLTRISFGQRPDANDRASGLPDAGFRWRYDGNIQGIDNIVLEPTGGITVLNGQHEIYGVTIAPEATLGGNSRYTLKPGGRFVNDGVLSPGNSIGRIDIVGNYQQGSEGILLMQANGAQEHDVLAIQGHADLNGMLYLQPQAGDWYGQNWRLRSTDLIQAGSIDGDFQTFFVGLNSPTLSVSSLPLVGTRGLEVRISRNESAYSRYAANANAEAAGRALYRLASVANSDTRSLLSTLDFSANDGSVITRALNQLTPSSYSAMVAGALNREQMIGGIVASRASKYKLREAAPDGWTGFAVPFGGGLWQDERGSMVGYDSSTYGVLFGTEKRSAYNPAWTYGAFGAVSGQSVDIDDPFKGKGSSTAFNLGVHARFSPVEKAGIYAFGHAQLGVEDAKLKRYINFEGYSAKHNADWTGWSGSLAVGGGYRWALSESVSVGPLMSLAYTHLSRPDMNESGPLATRLDISASRFNSLVSSLGFNVGVDLFMKNEADLRADLQVSWDHEWQDKDAILDVNFSGYPQVGFSSRNKVRGRDSLGLQAGLAYQVNENLSLGANISSQFFRAGQNSLAGNVSLNWQF